MMTKIEAKVVGYKQFSAKGKDYKLIAVEYDDKDTTGKMAGIAFVDKPFAVGTTVSIIIIKGQIYVV